MMVSLIDALGGLGIQGGGGSGGRGPAPTAFAPVGTVAQSIKGGKILGAPGAVAPKQDKPVSAATTKLGTDLLVSGDVGDQTANALGLTPTTKDSIILGLTAGLESGGLEGGAIGALRGFSRGKAIERGRPGRAEAKKTAAETAQLEKEKTESEIAENIAQATPEFGLITDEAAERFPNDPAAQQTFIDGASAFRRAGASTTTVGTKAEGALAIERAKGRAKRESAVIEPIQEAAAGANGKIEDLQKLQLAAPRVITGPFAEGRANMARVANWFGMDDLSESLIGKLPSAELMQSANVALTARAIQVLSGATSDFEFKTFQSSFPRLASSPEGNQLLAQIGIAAEQNKIALNNELNDYLNEFDGDLRPKGEESWNQRRDRFFEENPVLTPEIRSQLQGIRNKGFRSPEQEQRVENTVTAIDNNTLDATTATNFPINSEDVQMLSFNDLGAVANNQAYWEKLSPEVQVILLNEITKRAGELK